MFFPWSFIGSLADGLKVEKLLLNPLFVSEEFCDSGEFGIILVSLNLEE